MIRQRTSAEAAMFATIILLSRDFVKRGEIRVKTRRASPWQEFVSWLVNRSRASLE